MTAKYITLDGELLIKICLLGLLLLPGRIQLNSYLSQRSAEIFTELDGEFGSKFCVSVFASTPSEFNWRAIYHNWKFYWTRWRILIKILPVGKQFPANFQNWIVAVNLALKYQPLALSRLFADKVTLKTSYLPLAIQHVVAGVYGEVAP